jgi:hypothetical protein
MKRTMVTMTFATAALLAAAATGSAQSMKAEIPFAFEVAHTRMQPGTYQVGLYRNSGSVPIVRIYNYDDRGGAMALPLVSDDHATREDPVLSFECTEGHCVLAKLWDGSGNLIQFATPKAGPATRIATVPLHQNRGE